MRAFSESLRTVYVQIDEFLATELAHRNPILTNVDIEEYPLLLLEVDDDVAGFAVVDTNVKELYPRAYKAFEKLYAQQRSKWSAKNLSFVLCRADNDRDLDAFYRRIEGDMYFCQKFVIDVGRQARELMIETVRLPFMPLRSQPGLGIGSVIPAKSFLVENNVDTKLADFIVTVQRRSAARILEDSLLGKFKRGTLKKVSSSSPQTTTRTIRERARLSSLSICDFRAYRGIHTFDLDHDVVLLYGPNGLGKTSFFDAIDFFCTGRIGRLGSANSKSDRFTKVTTHLDGAPAKSAVTASLRFGDKSKTFTRLVSERNYVTDGLESLDRKGLLTLLTGISPKAKQTRIENLQRLFRATHYFGQGYQELLQNFRNDSTLSEDVVARMVVVEDYVEASKKLNGVCVHSEKKINDLKVRGDSLLCEITDLDSKIAELKKAQGADETVGILVAPSTERFETNLRSALSIDRDDAIDLINSKITSSYENMLHAETTTQKAQLSELETLAAKMGVIAEKSSDLKDSERELAAVSKKISKLNKQVAESHNNVNENEKRIADIAAERNSLEREVEVRRWLDSAHPEILKYQQNIGRLEAERNKVSTNLTLVDKQIVDNSQDVSKARERLADEKATLENGVKKVNAILQLRENLENWVISLKKRQRLTDEIVVADKNKFEEIGNRDKARDALAEAEVTLSAAQKELDSVESEAATLSKLLRDAESLVHDDECPVCGTHHKSKSALISLIQSRQEHPTAKAKEVSDRYSAAQKIIRSKNEMFKKVAGNLRRIEIEQQSRKSQIDELDQIIEGFLSEAKFLELPPDVQIFPEKLYAEAESHNTILKKQRTVIVVVEKELSKLLEQRRMLQANREQLDASAEELRSEIRTKFGKIGGLKHSGQELGLVEDQDLAKVQVRPLSEINAALASVSSRLALANRELKDANDVLSKSENQVSSLQKRHTILTSNVISAKNDQREVTRRLRILGIKSKDLNNEGIGKRENELNSSITKNEELIEELRKLIVFLERSESTHELSALESERTNLQNQRNVEINKELNLLTDWLAYFRSIKTLIDKERQDAVRKYVEQLGPLSFLMQERLRPVYGFGGISLEAVDGSIVTEVKYRDKSVRPSDYFSDSQKQILMLSLFLAAAITQSWSSFGPILLDDPVTHFDDLNAYSLAELMKSLVQQREGNAQFMISICEERIYHLLRQKFSRCPELDVIAYEFLSIGNRGPEYRQVPDKIDRISLVAG